MRSAIAVSGFIIILLLWHVVPAVQAQSTSTPTYTCPPQAMNLALPLSEEINSIPLNLSANSTPSQIASQVNEVFPYINSSLKLGVPVLSGSSDKLKLLVAPFETFESTSHAVNQNDPDSACNFLVATFFLAAIVIIVGTGNLPAASFLEAATADCGSGCATTIATEVYNFTTANYSNLSSDWESTACNVVHALCVPEFPVELVPVIAVTALIVLFYLVVRRAKVRSEESGKVLLHVSTTCG